MYQCLFCSTRTMAKENNKRHLVWILWKERYQRRLDFWKRTFNGLNADTFPLFLNGMSNLILERFSSNYHLCNRIRKKSGKKKNSIKNRKKIILRCIFVNIRWSWIPNNRRNRKYSFKHFILNKDCKIRRNVLYWNANEMCQYAGVKIFFALNRINQSKKTLV